MNRASWILLVILLLAAGTFFAFRAMQPGQPPTPATAPPEPAPAPPEEPAPAPAFVPETLPPPAVEPTGKPLPVLDDSDPEVRDAAIDLLGEEYVEQLLTPADIVRKAVVTLDNLPRDKIALRLRVVPALPGRFITSGDDDQWTVISAENFARYTPWVKVFTATDTEQIHAVYSRLYPLFQQAYQELGYPDAQFNDRVIAVLDDLLAAPDIDGPIRLVRPHVLYQFADPELEARSAGQKTLIRMGRENAALVKAKLREIRASISADRPH
ncbi:MAG: DUF3014 domain-containing protein [Gammaproteobacteria bacterium]